MRKINPHCPEFEKKIVSQCHSNIQLIACDADDALIFLFTRGASAL